ncbi:ferredoxin [Pseudonocardia alni]|uniref:ferredoxin n=1 Tax=Pseudonocardia alni TaxID=33907 RepID=UPI0006CB2329|nr:ferredoxin [Pseudonocardia sp. AL041005-10]ALE78600.1 ferredoxin [Pseudonocardia sp. AL041005-10]
MRVVVDYDKCTGLGLCESLAPDFFEVADDGSLNLLRAEADEAQRSELEEAVRACPTEALRIEG